MGSESKYGAAETNSGAAVFLCSLTRRREVVDERLDAALQFVAGATKGLELHLGASGHNRIVDAPVNPCDAAGENGTALVGVIANRNHAIKLLIQKLIDGLRSMLRDIDPNLTHRLDGLRAHKAGRNARAENFKPIAGQMTQESFSHLAARRVARAENQNPFPFLLISHSYLASDPIAETK
jgi:hypothetical protein